MIAAVTALVTNQLRDSQIPNESTSVDLRVVTLLINYASVDMTAVPKRPTLLILMKFGELVLNASK